MKHYFITALKVSVFICFGAFVLLCFRAIWSLTKAEDVEAEDPNVIYLDPVWIANELAFRMRTR